LSMTKYYIRHPDDRRLPTEQGIAGELERFACQ